MLNQRIVNGIAVTVVAIWGVSMIVDMFSKGYDPPVGIYPALMLVLGGIFGVKIVRGNG